MLYKLSPSCLCKALACLIFHCMVHLLNSSTSVQWYIYGIYFSWMYVVYCNLLIKTKLLSRYYDGVKISWVWKIPGFQYFLFFLNLLYQLVKKETTEIWNHIHNENEVFLLQGIPPFEVLNFTTGGTESSHFWWNHSLLPLSFRLSDQSTQLEYRRLSASFIHYLNGIKLQIWGRVISVYYTRTWFVHYQFSWKGLWWGSRVEQGVPALSQLLQSAETFWRRENWFLLQT